VLVCARACTCAAADICPLSPPRRAEHAVAATMILRSPILLLPFVRLLLHSCHDLLPSRPPSCNTILSPTNPS
jgi:hypothetical protein